MQTMFCHPWDPYLPPPPPPHSCTAGALQGHERRQPMAADRGNIWSKNQEYWRIHQGLDGNWTNTGRPKVTNIEYNTVANLFN